MSWINGSSFRPNFGRQRMCSVEELASADPSACYDSFREHWQQAYKIIKRNQQSPTHDDVLGVVNHLEQIMRLLLYELKNREVNTSQLPTSENCTPCLEHLLSENLLDKLFEWGLRTGRYNNAVRLEQMKLYEMLVSQSSHLLLVHEPFLKPLLKLLMSCQAECFPPEVESGLVALLNQLCISLMQNVELLDLFFCSRPSSNAKFIIFSLLIPFVHREGPIGFQARDALLLCMTLSKRNTIIGMYIAEHSNVCPVLATGLSGLYSVLPRTLDIEVEDWHRLTADDVKDISELALFMNSLEFCNAVAQVAHPYIKKQLMDFFNNGFLIPVLSSALLEANVDEQIAAIAYLDLILRSVTNPGLLPAVIHFLLEPNYNNTQILDLLIERINGPVRLCLVSLALFDTLVDLNCEDIMLELIFRHLRPCSHVMLSQRHLISGTDAYCLNTDKLLSLTPNCCRPNISTPVEVRRFSRTSSNGSSEISMSLPSTWSHYGSQQNESLYGNYHAYLCDARQKIFACRQACESWSSEYDSKPKHKQLNSKQHNILVDNGASVSASDTLALEEFLTNDSVNSEDICESADRTAMNSLQSLGESSGYESLKFRVDEINSSKPIWKISSKTNNDQYIIDDTQPEEINKVSPCVGQFLDTIFNKLSSMLTNNFYVNLHLTGIISRLAVYPQTLLQSYLLNHQLVLQPNVQSLFQVAGSIKLKIDEYVYRHSDASQILEYARDWLLERECRLVNSRRKAIESVTSSTSNSSPNEQIRKHEVRRPSFTTSLSSMFRRTSIGSNYLRNSKRYRQTTDDSPSQELPMLMTQNELTVRSPSTVDNVFLSAVLLDEWLKEIAAISQEHSIAQLTDFISRN